MDNWPSLALPNLHSAKFDTGSKLLSRQPASRSSCLVPTQRMEPAREEMQMSKIASFLVCGVFAFILASEAQAVPIDLAPSSSEGS